MKATVKNNSKKASTTTTKIVNVAKTLKDKSKGQLALEERINQLETKQATESLTRQELIVLVNAKEKLESKTITRVYRELELKYKAKDSNILAIIGKSEFPTFKVWAGKMPLKHMYSFWDGLQCLSKFNKVAVIKTKVAKQNKAVKSI
jgi:hypothetical protein